MGSLSVWHWVIILAVVILLFGAKKLPDAARGLGRSLRILKSEVNAMGEDKKKAEAAQAAQAPAPAPAPQPTLAPNEVSSIDEPAPVADSRTEQR